MANPPAVSLQDRLLRLVQTLQFGWFVGHVSMLFFTLRYALYYITFKTSYKFAIFSYRTAFVSALVTYGIVVYKGYRARVRTGKPTTPLALIGDENVQYLLMASLWFWSRQIPLALAPFSVYSIFHVLTYIRGNIIPAVQSPSAPIAPTGAASPTSPKVKPQGAVAENIGNFIKEYYDLSMSLVAGLEILLWVRILGSALLFQKGSWILFLAYTVFLRARYAQSSFVQNTFAGVGARLDGVLANQSTDPNVRNIWQQVKGGLKAGVDATDLNRYLGGGQIGPAGSKKAQ